MKRALGIGLAIGTVVLLPVAARPLPAQEAGPEAPQAVEETVRLPAGAVLREVASPVARVLAVLPAAASLPVLDRSGDWVRVTAGAKTGWVDLAAAAAAGGATAGGGEVGGEPTAGATGGGGQTAGPGPAESAAAASDGRAPAAGDTAAALLAASRAALGAGVVEIAWDRFAVVTDRPTHPLLALGAPIAAELPALHARRYGLPAEEPAAPAGAPAVQPPPRGTIVLFGRDADYLEVLAAVAVEASAQGLAGYADGSVAVLPLGDRTARQAAGTLAHEITHLLNERAFGPALPPWLDEGMAGDVELIEIGTRGELYEGRWAEGPSGYRGRRGRTGPLIALERLLLDAARGRLETLPGLVALDRRSLLSSPRRPELYALAALWVRYLLDQPDRAAAFRRFLGALAAAPHPPADGGAALLAETLATDLTALEGPFRRWLRDVARRH